MNKEECRQLVDAYVEWLREGLNIQPLNDVCELMTPFLDRHNDHLQIYATQRDGSILLSDDGYIFSELRTSGLELNTQKRKELVQEILNAFGIKLENGKLITEASTKTLGRKVHSLLQAMLAMNDLYLLAQPRVASYFWEDVQKFLDEHNVRYSPRVKLTGRSGFDQAIDFLIPKSQTRPERLLKAIANPTKATIGTYLWSLADTRAARTGHGEAEAYAFLDDRAHDIGRDVIDALNAYEVRPVLWHARDEHVNELE
jgi:hypothetical protein